MDFEIFPQPVDYWLEVEFTGKPREVLVRAKVAILPEITVDGLFYSENRYDKRKLQRVTGLKRKCMVMKLCPSYFRENLEALEEEIARISHVGDVAARWRRLKICQRELVLGI